MELVAYQNKLEKFHKLRLKLERKLQDPVLVKKQDEYSSVSIEYNEIKEKITLLENIVEKITQIEENQELLKSEQDQDMISLIKSDLETLEKSRDKLAEKFIELEIEKDPRDTGNAIIEIRAGAGGEESALFAQELYRAYSKYAESLGFKVEVASISYANVGGFKEIVFFVNGNEAYKSFKFESGVHRVQRVPVTESSGRIHTSTVSVVVLSESKDIEVEIKDEDLRIDVYRASGPGGQSVNTTDSAVRIVHGPTNITVTCQDQKSQHKNRAKALKILQAKLYDQALEKKQAAEKKIRRSAIQTGDRSAKIRTYNFPQSRITEHRINTSWHNINEVMEGDFSEIVEALTNAELQEKINEQE